MEHFVEDVRYAHSEIRPRFPEEAELFESGRDGFRWILLVPPAFVLLVLTAMGLPLRLFLIASAFFLAVTFLFCRLVGVKPNGKDENESCFVLRTVAGKREVNEPDEFRRTHRIDNRSYYLIEFEKKEGDPEHSIMCHADSFEAAEPGDRIYVHVNKKTGAFDYGFLAETPETEND